MRPFVQLRGNRVVVSDNRGGSRKSAALGRLAILLAVLVLPVLLSAQTADTSWVRTYAGTGNGDDEPIGIAVDDSGNVYVAGYAYNNNSSLDYVTVRYSPTGVRQWAAVYNGPYNGDDMARAIALDRLGNIYVTGWSDGGATSRDYATVKYSPSGTQLWVQRYNGPGTSGDDMDEGQALAVDDSGSVYVTGFSGKYPDFDYATIKYTTSGTQLWVARYAGPDGTIDAASAIAVDRGRSVYITGASRTSDGDFDYATVKYNGVGAEQWVQRYNGSSNGNDSAVAIAADTLGYVYVTGTSIGSGGTRDYATLKYNSAGTLQWVDRYDGPPSGDDAARAIAADNTGGCCVTGMSRNSAGNYDIATVKYGPTGSRLWLPRYNGTSNGDDEGRAIVVDCYGNCYVAGTSYGGSGTSNDFITIKYNSSGTQQFIVRYDGSGHAYDAANAIAVRASAPDTFYVTGRAFAASNYDYSTIKYYYWRDVGVTAITVPGSQVDSGIPIVPACSVYNYGTTRESYNVRMKVGSPPFYNQSVSVSNHDPATSRYVTFPTATSWPRGGPYSVSCSTDLGADLRRSNDKLTRTTFVRVLDAQVLAIPTPADTVDSGPALQPQARIRNNGNTTVTISSRFSIGTAYQSTRSLSSMAAGEERLVTFDAWVPARGTDVANCTTLLAGDCRPNNNELSRTVAVRITDVGVTALVAPGRIVDPGDVVTPRVKVRNSGTAPADFSVRLVIEGSYTDSQPVTGLAPNEERLVVFANWTAANRGAFPCRCSTRLAPDQNPGNNLLTSTVRVAEEDVGVMTILSPVGAVDTSVAIVPRLNVRNFGEVAESFWSYLQILDSAGSRLYLDSARAVNLEAGHVITLALPEWAGTNVRGEYAVRCSTYLPDEIHPVNDTLSGRFLVDPAAHFPAAWSRRANVPMGSREKMVKDGGSLAPYRQTGPDYVYALKGNNSCEFYCYNTGTNTWAATESIPAFGRSGAKRAVKKGGSLTSGGGIIYAVKGNRTLEFWQFDPQEVTKYPWKQLADVPAGNKTPQDGAALAAMTVSDTTFVYLLKGAGTYEYYRYNTITGRWQTLSPAPSGSANKGYKAGSCLAADQGNRIVYALKGTTNEFFAYRVDSGRWTTRSSMPLLGSSGKKKRVKDGAGIACLDSLVFALKGGNTREFFNYRTDSDRWVAREEMPDGGGKRVKAGGGLIAAGNILYALKGNNTPEFWAYNLGFALLGASPAAPSVQSAGWEVRAGQLRVLPNPLHRTALINYSLPTPGLCRIRVYDVTGSLARTMLDGPQTAGEHQQVFDRGSLASGIYLLRVETRTALLTQKLLID